MMLSYISFCSKIPYNSILLLMATSLKTNAVIVRRVYCTTITIKLGAVVYEF